MSTARVIAKHQTLAEKEMESWVCLLLLFYCTAVTVSQKCTQEGAVEVIGTVTPKLIAGRLEICYNGIWRAVYDREWSETEARIVCGVKGFPREGTFACENSCFGASSLPTGYENFRDCNQDAGLLACGELEDQQRENDNAGIVCIQPGEVSNLFSEKNCAGEGAALGIIIAILIFTVVGVVIWAIISHRKGKKTDSSKVSSKTQEKGLFAFIKKRKQQSDSSKVSQTTQDDGPVKNPSYTPTAASNALGPRDTPTGQTLHTQAKGKGGRQQIATSYEVPEPSVGPKRGGDRKKAEPNHYMVENSDHYETCDQTQNTGINPYNTLFHN